MIIPNFSGIFSKNNLFGIYVFGSNSSGRLGLGDTVGRSIPVSLNSLNEWSHVSGSLHSLAVKSDGTLWSWGLNDEGELGLGDANKFVPYPPFFIFADRSSPVQVGFLQEWKKVFSGFKNSFAIKNNGTLWAWGSNSFGQLGLGDFINRSSPVQVGVLSDWLDISVGPFHSLAVKSDGSLWSWGAGNAGQLGQGNSVVYTFSPVLVDSNNVWKSVHANGNTSTGISLGIKSDGTLWSWGHNSEGQLGLGDTVDRSSPVQIGNLNEWIKVSGTNASSLAIKADRTLWSWGRNSNGQLGLGDTIVRSSPVQVGVLSDWYNVKGYLNSVVAIKKDRTLWSWGSNNNGQLGLGDTVNRSSPVQVKLEKFSLSGNSFIKDNGYLYGFGANGSGQIGDGSVVNKSSPVKIGLLNDWKLVKKSMPSDSYPTISFSFAIKNNGTLWSWGRNGNGQLGLGDTVNRSSPVQVGSLSDWLDVACGYTREISTHTISVKSDGTLWSWGSNGTGQLGLGNSIPRSSPVQITASSDFRSVSASGSFSFAIKNNGTLWSWGRNNNGQLGLGDTVSRSSPVQVGSLSDWLDVACSAVDYYSAHTIAVKSDGTLWSWGSNGTGQLGLGDSTPRSSPVQIGLGNDWYSVSAGKNHSIAIKNNSTIWAWGWNFRGQLGNGQSGFDSVNISSPIQIGSYSDWKLASAGREYSIAVRSNGTLWSWGLNDNGQLGLGDTVDRSSPVKIGNIFYTTKWNLNRVSNPGNFILLAKK
jgi:alpha-tubulin suppressor-like RCC1 family protein